MRQRGVGRRSAPLKQVLRHKGAHDGVAHRGAHELREGALAAVPGAHHGAKQLASPAARKRAQRRIVQQPQPVGVRDRAVRSRRLQKGLLERRLAHKVDVCVDAHGGVLVGARGAEHDGAVKARREHPRLVVVDAVRPQELAHVRVDARLDEAVTPRQHVAQLGQHGARLVREAVRHALRRLVLRHKNKVAPRIGRDALQLCEGVRVQAALLVKQPHPPVVQHEVLPQQPRVLAGRQHVVDGQRRGHHDAGGHGVELTIRNCNVTRSKNGIFNAQS